MASNPSPRRRRARRAHAKPIRRRRNGSRGKVTAAQILTGALGAVGGILAVGYLLPKVIDMNKNPYLYLGAGAALGVGGGLALGRMNPAAGVGLGAGVIASLATPYVSAIVAPALPEAPTTTAGYLMTTGAVEIPTGAVEIPMGAVEIPTGSMYDVDGDGMVAIDDGYDYGDDA
jgi:hypothetical protein